jgi:hypothetical protein
LKEPHRAEETEAVIIFGKPPNPDWDWTTSTGTHEIVTIALTANKRTGIIAPIDVR